MAAIRTGAGSCARSATVARSSPSTLCTSPSAAWSSSSEAPGSTWTCRASGERSSSRKLRSWQGLGSETESPRPGDATYRRSTCESTPTTRHDADGRRARQGPGRGAAVHQAVPRPDRRDQGRRQRHRPRARRDPARHRSPALRRDAAGARAWRRSRDQRHERASRAQARVQERTARHRRQDDGGREDGADRQGQPRPRRRDPPAGWSGGGHERGGRTDDHRRATRRHDGIRRQGDAGQQGADHRVADARVHPCHRLDRAWLRRPRLQHQRRHRRRRDRGRAQGRQGHPADGCARGAGCRRAGGRGAFQRGRATSDREGRGHRRHDPQARGVSAGARWGAARAHRRRSHQTRAAARAVHRGGDRKQGPPGSSSTRATPELAAQDPMPTRGRLPVTFVRGNGCRIYDESGREYLDLVAGIAVNLLGHAHPDVVRAVSAQAGALIHTSNLYFTQPQIDLARRLVELSFPSRVFFCNSGAEANEAAIKLARKWGARNRDGAFEIITTTGSFHGRTLATVTAGGQPKYSDPFKPLPDGFVHVPYNDLDAIKAATGEKTVAVMLETVMGEIGIVPARDGYLAGVRKWCDEKGLLLILDEVQTGLGRTGRWFAHQHHGITPDVMTLAKGLGGGVPIGACLAAPKADVFKPADNGPTSGRNPPACAAALAGRRVIGADGP